MKYTKKQRLTNLAKARRVWGSMSHADRKRMNVYTPHETPKKYINKISYTDRGAIYKGGKRRIFHLPIETAVYVPSTSKGQKPISNAVLKRRVTGVRTFLATKYGGYTAISGIGGYKMGKKTVQEPVVKVTAFASVSDFKRNHPKVRKQLSNWRKKWGQNSMGYEYEGDLYYIK